MRRAILALLIMAGAAYAAESPLLLAPAKDVSEWKKKLGEFERPELPKAEGYPKPFHLPNSYKYALDDICLACHTFAAHRKDEKYAPFYNAHGTFLGCNTCHFVREGITYGWAEIKNGKVIREQTGDFYGLKYISVGDKVLLSGGDSKARIVPFYAGKPVDIPLEGNESLLKDEEAVAKMHSALTDKPFKCDDCHKPNGRLDFRTLGFSPERVKDLEHNEILKGLKEYETLHFPKFIW